MKIIEYCTSEALGGLELYFHQCSRRLSASHDLIAVVREGSRLAESARMNGVRHVALKQLSRPVQLFSDTRQLISLIRAHGIDIVHVHHKKDLLTCALAKVVSRKKFRLVHTRQMQLPHRKKDPYHRFIYSQIDLYIAITEQLKEAATRRLPIPAHKIKRLYYGVPPTRHLAGQSPFDEVLSPEQLSGAYKIGFFSRIGPKKGHHTFLNACKILKDKGYGLVCLIYGNVMSEAYYGTLQEIIARDGMEDMIYFRGFHRQPASIMPCFDLIVMPSLDETFGLVAVEAMRGEVPVVATRYGGLTEIIDHEQTGLLFEKENVGDLALQIERLIRDPAWSKALAKKGKEKADRQFDEKQHFVLLEKMLLEIDA